MQYKEDDDMDIKGLPFIVDFNCGTKKLVFSEELGISHCHDVRLKEELSTLVPLNILRTGRDAVLEYLNSIEPICVEQEVEFLKGLERRLNENYLSDKLSFCPNGQVVCSDEELVKDILKKIPKEIFSKGANPVRNHLSILIKKQEELLQYLIKKSKV